MIFSPQTWKEMCTFILTKHETAFLLVEGNSFILDVKNSISEMLLILKKEAAKCHKTRQTTCRENAFPIPITYKK